MTKNLVLLKKRRPEVEDILVKNVQSGKNREPFFIANNNNNMSTTNNNNNNNKPVHQSTDKATQVVIFRKINSLRSKANSFNKQLLDKKQEVILKNNFTTFSYCKKTAPVEIAITAKHSEHEKLKHPEKGVKVLEKAVEEEEEEEGDEEINIVPIKVTQTSNFKIPSDNHSSNHSEKLDQECLFCKYEKVISSDKLPNFARKRITEIFNQLSNPEKYTAANKKSSASSKNTKTLSTKLTRSHASFAASSSYLTSSQILDY